MADDIRVEEFENNGGASQGNRVRSEDSAGGGLGNSNTDLRERGDADDIAEVVTQVDAETAISEVGLRSDSPVDLTREEVKKSPQQSADTAATEAVVDTPQQSGADQTVESQTIVDGSTAAVHDDTGERTSGNDAAVQANEISAEAVARATTANGTPAPVAPEGVNPAAQTDEPAEVPATPETGAVSESAASAVAEQNGNGNGDRKSVV